MARGGINKAVVQKAQQALLARGLNPSIDAVRVELGNTGSKTTISRYLKELESLSPGRVAPRERLGEQLTGIVETLLDRLMEEGEEALAQARSSFELERAELNKLMSELTAEFDKAQQQIATMQSALEAQDAELQTTLSSLQTELLRNAGLSQRCTALETIVTEKDTRIQSLEEKHTHARGALEHYRESVKEQRDQDQRRHESQLNEMQVEQRKLRETLAVKQDELTRLNRDNERLLAEARQQAKTLHTQHAQIGSLTGEIQELTKSAAKSAGVAEHLLEELSAMRKETHTLRQSATEAESREQKALELVASVQNKQLLERQGRDAETAQTLEAGEKSSSEPTTSSTSRRKKT
ncbi:DNA-binding protein [Pseudomonas sp. 18.1.10]|uniref:DNA-binding protein n=1 Tax=Pseudomonas sp. 18.1.10 TaxID=2969302 RepID=UPI00214FA479|nr:DNA-binding protein [Pseudomonas sp. 18.1.10]MCR4536887.1 DNA-binding protein [Pseudomonas sp. 18.1.10]